MQRVRLRWIDPAVGPQERLVEETPLTIGREAGNAIVLKDENVSRHHAVLERRGDQVVVRDLESRNGIRVNGQRVTHAPLADGSTLQIGSFMIAVTVEQPDLAGATAVTTAVPEEATLIAAGFANEVADAPPHAASAAAYDSAEEMTLVTPVLRAPTKQTDNAPAPLPGTTPPAPATDWPPALFRAQQVAAADLMRLGLPVLTTEYLTLGAGLGSFVFTDLLRICGAPVDQVAAIGLDPCPYAHYRLLTSNSQIPPHERIRSNSESTPDNIWGYPGYAAREIWSALMHANPGRAASLFWQILGEPTFTDTYTPLIGRVFASIDREARRIGWEQIVRLGRIRAIRKTDDDRYVIAYSPPPAQPGGRPGHALALARYLHLATGYPAIQFLPDLQRYRAETGDFRSVVNAYEEHDHLYAHLRAHGGVVLLRGRGIVASRVLQRLAEERAQNPDIRIIHLLRSPIAQGHRYGRSQRQVIVQFEFQPFNWPRGCWTGPQRQLLERASPAERQQLLEVWGGTTTAKRRDWVALTRQGQREGWYQIVFGQVMRVERTPQGELVTVVAARDGLGELHYATDFIIDATGLEARVTANPLLRDLVEQYQLALNPLGRLHVENDFEVMGMRNGSGRMYAAGAITLGGPNAGVDTFLGLQYAAYRAVDALVAQHALGLRKLAGLRSVWQWLKWVQGAAP